MQKLVVVIGLSIICAVGTSARAEAFPAIRIKLYGRAQEPGQGDQAKVLTAIGNFLPKLGIRKFLLQNIGREGGFTACIETFFEPEESVISQLSAIEVDRKESSYSVTKVDECVDKQ